MGVPVSELARRILKEEGLEGITVSGGEPMEQAGQLSLLIDLVRAVTDLGVVLFTGYRHEYLTKFGSDEQNALLGRVDLLVDGPFLAAAHSPRLLRGSDNQRLVLLTDRYATWVKAAVSEGDRPAGMEFVTSDDGVLSLVGIPPTAGFLDSVRSRLAERGVILYRTRG